jgi:hypothetical protein
VAHRYTGDERCLRGHVPPGENTTVGAPSPHGQVSDPDDRRTRHVLAEPACFLGQDVIGQVHVGELGPEPLSAV